MESLYEYEIIHYLISIKAIFSNFNQIIGMNFLQLIFHQLYSQNKKHMIFGNKSNWQLFWSKWSTNLGPLFVIFIYLSSSCCFHFNWWVSYEATSGLRGVVIASVEENVDSNCFRSTVSGKGGQKIAICQL